MELVFKTLHNKSQYRFVLIPFFPMGEKEVERHSKLLSLSHKKVLHSKQKGFAWSLEKVFVRPTGELECLL